MRIHIFSSLLAITGIALLSACGLFGSTAKVDEPKSSQLGLFESRGSLMGDDSALSFGGPKDKDNNSGVPGLGVNVFLWRATLDTLGFMPLASADPFGGVVITDWYEDPKAKGERYKVNVLILDRTLRADGVKVTLFKQKLDENGIWRDTEVGAHTARNVEETILTRAREMRLAQTGK
jgi:hypothetical protein